MNTHAQNPWLRRVKTAPSSRARLVCLPHAGGGASTFSRWERALPTGIEIWPVELPGRETRFEEALPMRLDQLADDLAGVLQPRTQDMPLFLYGHSMGALLAFEVAQRLESGGTPPALLLVAGCRAPHLARPRFGELPDLQLIEALDALDDVPNPAFQNPELIDLCLPIMRADLVLFENHPLSVTAPQLRCAMSAFGGDLDPVASRQEVALWQVHTSGSFTQNTFAGRHFFVARMPFLKHLASVLDDHASSFID